jgi:hypothetical protein
MGFMVADADTARVYGPTVKREYDERRTCDSERRGREASRCCERLPS